MSTQLKLNEVLPDDLLIQDVTADEVREAISDAKCELRTRTKSTVK